MTGTVYLPLHPSFIQGIAVNKNGITKHFDMELPTDVWMDEARNLFPSVAKSKNLQYQKHCVQSRSVAGAEFKNQTMTPRQEGLEEPVVDELLNKIFGNKNAIDNDMLSLIHI